VLERVPENQNGWKPHEKSMELGHLAALLATMPSWVAFMIELDGMNPDDPSNNVYKPRAVESRAELLNLLDESLTKANSALEKATDEHLQKNCQCRVGGRIVNEEVRYAMLLNGCFSHLAHHRGQLTVCLRLMDAKVPAIFGPSADERL
jgi:uncharacterized damage-inducible protein DinB